MSRQAHLARLERERLVMLEARAKAAERRRAEAVEAPSQSSAIDREARRLEIANLCEAEILKADDEAHQLNQKSPAFGFVRGKAFAFRKILDRIQADLIMGGEGQ